MDYTIIDNKIIYMLISHDIVEYNLDDSSLRKMHVKADTVCLYIDIYTGDNKLFAKRQIKNTFDIVEFVVEDNQVIERELGQ